MKKISSSNNKGLALIETLLVVALVSAMIIGGLLVYSKISFQNKILDEVKLINIILHESEIYIKSNRLSSLTNKDLADLKILESNNLNEFSSLKTKISNNVVIDTIYNNKEKFITHLRLTYNEFNPEYCAQFISKVEPQISFASINGVIVKNNFTLNDRKTYDLPLMSYTCSELSKNLNNFKVVLVFPYVSED